METVQTDLDVINMLTDAHQGAIRGVGVEVQSLGHILTIITIEVTKAQFDFIASEVSPRAPLDGYLDSVLLAADTSSFNEDGSRREDRVLLGVWKGFN